MVKVNGKAIVINCQKNVNQINMRCHTMSNKDSSNLKDSNGLVGWLNGQKHLPCKPEDLN